MTLVFMIAALASGLAGTTSAARSRQSATVPSRDTVVVSPSGPVRRIGAAIAAARNGTTILVRAGVYAESTIVVSKTVSIIGVGDAVIDGRDAREIMRVTANDVVIRGLHFRNVGSSYIEDRAALRVSRASGCTIENNVIENAFFGIYLADVTDCRVSGNVIRGQAKTEGTSGNGIHLWTSRRITIVGNTISGHRDGIYFEFVHNSEIRDNVSEKNLRYGLHFMFSDDCRYVGNTFRRNGSGVAVMYTKHVAMIDNWFEDNWGPAAYGLLLKEISDPVLTGNTFSRNTVGLYADGAMRIEATNNSFLNNGWAIKLMSSTSDGRFAANAFVGNSFDVATNSRSSTNAFESNYWDSYHGYDLDRNGLGDVPHRPVRLYASVVSQDAISMILMRGLFVGLLDAAERAMPVFTPVGLTDAHPRMRR
jgi:nitrous oxidase accessory protein